MEVTEKIGGEDNSLEIGKAGGTLPVIESEEDLASLITEDEEEEEEEETTPSNKKTEKKPEKKENEEDDDDDDEDSIIKFTSDKDKKSKGDDVEEEEEEEEEDNSDDDEKAHVEKYPSVVHYLADKHKIKFNLEALPDKGLTRKQEAEVVSGIMDRMSKGVNNALREYRDIAELVKDEEIAQLIAAKKEGKTLKDLFSAFSTTASGMDDETLVSDDLKKRYPKMNEKQISTLLESMKAKDDFKEVATAIREQRVEEETAAAAKAAEDEAKAETLQKQQKEAAKTEFASFVKRVTTVAGVPVDEEMMEEIVRANTEEDEDGFSYLDYALQSNEGRLLAALGLLHLPKLINASTSLKVNKKNKSLVDKLLNTPEELQSKGSTSANDEEFDIEAANQF